GAAERAALALALFHAGVEFPNPKSLAAADVILGDLARDRGDADGGLLLWTSPSTGTGYAWTLGLAAPSGALPDLSAFHEAFPGGPGRGTFADGEMSITLANTRVDRRSPAGEVVRAQAGGQDVVTAGTVAEDALARFEAHLATGRRRAWPAPPEEGLRLVASFWLSRVRARTILAGELEPGGFLAALAEGDIEGALWTDGRILRLEARVRRSP
ncbi:MAG: hypothetical protein ACYTG6_14600, partial [Planctomycetota bacterium]